MLIQILGTLVLITVLIGVSFKLFRDYWDWRFDMEMRSFQNDPQSAHNIFPKVDDDFRQWLKEGSVDDLVYVYCNFHMAEASQDHLNAILEELKSKMQ